MGSGHEHGEKDERSRSGFRSVGSRVPSLSFANEESDPGAPEPGPWDRESAHWASLDALSQGVIIAHEDGAVTSGYARALHKLLWWELCSRRLERLPPLYLAIYEFSSWSDKGALEALSRECVSYLTPRSRAMYLRTFGCQSIAPFVRKNLRRFLNRRQDLADRAGFYIYQNVRCALTDEHVLTAYLDAAQGISSLARARYLIPGVPRVLEEPCSAEELGRMLERSLDWPVLARALAEGVGAAPQEMLLGVLAGMTEEGLKTFRPSDLHHIIAHWGRACAPDADRVAFVRAEAMEETVQTPPAGTPVRPCDVLDFQALVGGLQTDIWLSSWSTQKKKEVCRLLLTVAELMEKGEPLLLEPKLAEALKLPLEALEGHWKSLSELAARRRSSVEGEGVRHQK